jgi:hypothetical protein
VNLATHYNKIIIPVDLFKSRMDFQRNTGMSPENLGELLKSNSDRYLPAIAGAPKSFERVGYYDDLFRTCHRLYGHYPPNLEYRVNRFQNGFILASMAAHAMIPQSATRMDETLRRFPELDLDYIAKVEVEELTGYEKKQLHDLSREWGQTPQDMKGIFVSNLFCLNNFGYGGLTAFMLNLHRRCRDLGLLFDILNSYRKYLVQPIETGGSWANYDAEDLEDMAFLRVLPLLNTDIEQLKEENQRLYLNSPGARSVVTLSDHKMNIFLRGGDDVRTLNKVWEIAEKHKRETEILAEYKLLAGSGKLKDAVRAFNKATQVCGQIGDEIEFWQREETRAKLAAYCIRGGVLMLSDIGLYLAQGIPAGWRLAIGLVKDVSAWLGVKLDPKRIVEWAYDVPISKWPWYEKGIPYLYWVKARQNQ